MGLSSYFWYVRGVPGGPDRPFSLTLIGGFLGAGKTTLLSRLLSEQQGLRLGVLVNDFGSLHLDAELIEEVRGGVMRLSNGCICCTLHSDLVSSLFQLIERGEVDHAIIETSGISDLRVLVRSFQDLERQGLLRLDGVISVVDAERFPLSQGEDRVLLEGQLQAADLVVLNKVELVGEEALTSLEAEIQRIAPRARRLRTSFGAVPLDLMLGIEATDRGVGVPIHEHHHHQGPAHAHFSTWSFVEEAPLSWKALAPILAQLPSEIVRAKGVLQLVERPDDRMLLQVVGARVHVRTLEKKAEKPRSEIIFIGRGADRVEESLRPKLLACRVGAPS